MDSRLKTYKYEKNFKYHLSDPYYTNNEIALQVFFKTSKPTHEKLIIRKRIISWTRGGISGIWHGSDCDIISVFE